MDQQNTTPPDEPIDDDHGLDPILAEISASMEQSTPRPPKPQIQDISHVHEQIMNWMLVNPHLRLKDCAAYFGYSQAWLSIIIHSDAFQAQLKEKQGKLFDHVVLGGVTAKMHALADVGISKLAEKLENTDDFRQIKETTELALKGLGFGQPRAPAAGINATNVQQNFYVASPEDLVAARARLSGQAPQEATPRDEATPLLPSPAPEEPQVQPQVQPPANEESKQ